MEPLAQPAMVTSALRTRTPKASGTWGGWRDGVAERSGRASSESAEDPVARRVVGPRSWCGRVSLPPATRPRGPSSLDERRSAAGSSVSYDGRRFRGWRVLRVARWPHVLSRRGCSSVGRAAGLQPAGRRFKSGHLHHHVVRSTTFSLLDGCSCYPFATGGKRRCSNPYLNWENVSGRSAVQSSGSGSLDIRCMLICMQSTSVRIDAETHEELKRLAKDLGTSVGQTVTLAVKALRQDRIGSQLAGPLRADEASWLDADGG